MTHSSSKFAPKLIFKASLWIFLAFGLSQALRLGGNLITTRLLVPEMFGVMAVVFAVMQGLSMIMEAGLWAYVVRDKDGDKRAIYDVAWTAQVLRGLIIFVLALIFVAVMAQMSRENGPDYLGIYTSSDFLWVMTVIAFTALLSGCNSMATALKSRELVRGKIEVMELSSQLVGFIVMIAWAWFYPSIWALASAAIVSSVSKLILSFSLFDYRHRFNFNKQVLYDMYLFGRWILLASILTFIAQSGDKLFFGSTLSAGQLGVYSIASMLALAFMNITARITTNILFPIFSRTANLEASALSRQYYNARFKIDSVLYLVAGFLFVFSPLIIDILYDERYQSAGQMLQILALSIPGYAMTAAAQECLGALGLTKIRTQVMLLRSITLVISLPLAYSYYSIEGAIIAIAVNPWLGLLVLLPSMKRHRLFNGLAELKALPVGVIGFILFFAILASIN
ncbi:MAG: oligosaccharide flippase family protein [Methylophaga sp.]|uniref:oligosaccharide flippase family protein n=1 Tax=Methylophaga sp. TaxID=2024840 RepID=UPI000C0CAE18|nr:oligosaccharide flippase family protein [Methylophaga sp.]MBL1457688.1 oligosaccharide flippase family protein [Methylophaga sp.]